MFEQEVFSWAEDENGKMVYIDDVPRGIACNCTCPHCHENLIARQGNERAHGFAHASKKRGANLKMCLKVITFKLAEQIIKTHKKVSTPSYYDIFKSNIIEFDSVIINDSFEREDRQPDIIATTKDNQKYLIEFCFKDFIRHKQTINYENLNFLEIDLAGQRIDNPDSLEKFLLECNENRRWLNHTTYFNSIETTYRNRNKSIRIVPEEECTKCPLKRSCCAVKKKDETSFLTIIHNSKSYRLCKTQLYDSSIKEFNKQKEEDNKIREQNLNRYQALLKKKKEKSIRSSPSITENKQFISQNITHQNLNTDQNDLINCFNCQKNLQWDNKDGLAHCGCYENLNIPMKVTPDHAKHCPGFKRKS